jgi:hypothetical protein
MLVNVSTQIEEVTSIIDKIAYMEQVTESIIHNDMFDVIIKNTKAANEKIILAENLLRTVSRGLDTRGVFEGGRYDQAMAMAAAAEDLFFLGNGDDDLWDGMVLNVKGLKKKARKAADDLGDHLTVSKDTLIAMKSLRERHQGIIGRRSSIRDLDQRLLAARKNTSPWDDAVDDFADVLKDLSGEISEAHRNQDFIDVLDLSRWALQLSLSKGVIDLKINPLTRSLIEEQSDRALENEAYGKLVAALDAVEVPNSLKQMQRDMKVTVTDFTRIVTSGYRYDYNLANLKQLRREFTVLRSNYVRMQSALSAVTGFKSELVGSLLGVIESNTPLLDGWGELLDMGRMDDLIDLNVNVATGAGLAANALRSLNLDVVPRAKDAFARVFNRVDEVYEQQMAALSAKEDSDTFLSESIDLETEKLFEANNDLEDLRVALDDLEESEEQREGKLSLLEADQVRQRRYVGE